MSKPSFTCFAQYRIGGVQSFYQNLLEGDKSNSFDKEIIFYDKLDEPTPKLLEEWKASQYKVLKYNSSIEEEYVYRNRLAKLLLKKKGVIITNFSLELRSITRSVFENNTIFHITHDDDYLNIATQYSDRIDVFIAHNPYYVRRLKELLPNRTSDIYYLPYGVDISETKTCINNTHKLRLLFLSRMDKTKGIHNIPKINDYLLNKNIDVEWVIMGNGPEKEFITDYIKNYKNFEYYTPKNITEIHSIAKTCDVYVLPSYIDGLPVSMLESMSVGLVPILFEFNPGIKEIIGNAGIVVPTDDIDAFSKSIIHFDKNRDLLIEFRQATIDLLTEKYDKYKNAKAYFDLVSKYPDLRKNNLRNKDVFSHLQKEEKIGLFSKIKEWINS